MNDYNNSHTTEKSRTPLIIGGLVAAAVVVGGLILFTDLDLKDTGSLPEVSVQAGEMPEVDLEVADIDVGTKKMEVKVPTIDVDLPNEGPNEADDLADDIEVDVDVDADVDADVKVPE